ncbi:MAG: S46 family peptidase, partial [Bacteroidaceae bacterium]|nr:S46 family peptidase [Bacteroidaceae bacterium]
YGFFAETFLRGIELGRVAAILDSKPAKMDSAEIAKTREQLQTFYKDYDARVDEETMAVLLDNYRQKVGKDYLPSFYKDIDSLFKGDTKAYARDIFSRTALTDIACLNRFVADSTLRDTDPMFGYYNSMTDFYKEMMKHVRDGRQAISYNEHMLTQAILERDQETPHYSDANFTLRLSYGFIQDYTAGEQHFDYYTNAQSLLDKAARQQEIEDYKLEEDIISLIRKRDFGRYADPQTKDLHLCFLSNNDITGGNSGSPMFNGRGELIGLAFDGNWEAMSGDITFNPELQRCIGVDIRFVLYLIDKWGHADRLIKEMGL